MKSRISLKPCPFCGARVEMKRGVHNVTFFLCTKERKRHYLPTTWETGEEVMRWWVGDDPRQITLEDMQW